MSRNRNTGGHGKRFLTVLLTLAMIVSLTPSLGALTGGALGAQEAYGAEGISGNVNASALTLMGEYNLTGDTILYIDEDIIIGSINVGDHTLTIEGSEGKILSVYGNGIEGYQGNVILNSGSLDLDTSAGEGNWTAAMDLTLGGFTMNGGGLFINYSGSGRYSSYGINAKSFTMTGGTANV
ncbi:MAG: hypothetical protein K6B12_05410, partial [Clostridiales bacterium]|nr:hypothetical protein [Clostridiales bacterium]